MAKTGSKSKISKTISFINVYIYKILELEKSSNLDMDASVSASKTKQRLIIGLLMSKKLHALLW